MFGFFLAQISMVHIFLMLMNTLWATKYSISLIQLNGLNFNKAKNMTSGILPCHSICLRIAMHFESPEACRWRGLHDLQKHHQRNISPDTSKDTTHLTSPICQSVLCQDLDLSKVATSHHETARPGLTQSGILVRIRAAPANLGQGLLWSRPIRPQNTPLPL